jgi:hypothetical protein
LLTQCITTARYKVQDLDSENKSQNGTKIIDEFTFFQIWQFNISQRARNGTKR